MNRLLYVVLSIGLFTSTSIVSANELEWNEDKIYKRLFYNHAADLDPEATFELLAKLVVIDKLQQSQPDFDIIQLLALGNFDQHRCDQHSLGVINRLAQRREFKSPNIQSYLNYCAEQKFLKCRDKLTQDLAETLAKLDKQDLMDLVNLDLVFIKPNNQTLTEKINHVNLENFSRGLTLFFDRTKLTLNKLMLTLLGNSYVIERQVNYIVDLCVRVTKSHKLVLFPFVEGAKRPGLLRTFNKFASDWIPRLKFCSVLVQKMYYHVEYRARICKEAEERLVAESVSKR